MKLKIVFPAILTFLTLSLSTEVKATFFLDGVPGDPPKARELPADFLPPDEEIEIDRSAIVMVFDCIRPDELQEAQSLREVTGSVRKFYLTNNQAAMEWDSFGLLFNIGFWHQDVVEMSRNTSSRYSKSGEVIRYRRAETHELLEADGLILENAYLDIAHGTFRLTKFRTWHEDGKAERGFSEEMFSCVLSM